MNMNSEKGDWPLPEIYMNENLALEKPEIPEKYTLFGIEFNVKDNIPRTDEEFEDLNVPKLKSMVNESLKTFKTIVKTNSLEDFEKIKNLHKEMNDMINRAKLWEAKVLMKKMKKEKNVVVRKLNDLIDKTYNDVTKEDLP